MNVTITGELKTDAEIVCITPGRDHGESRLGYSG
jgi:hypothetical protein